MTATLQNLAEDVVLNILCYCGISGVLAVSQTCRHLSTLAFTKPVWLSLLRDVRLLLDGWPELPLRQFTTAELIDLAKRMVQGPQTWSRSHPSRPVIVRQEVIHTVIKLGFGAMFWENEPKLLSGGQYILFSNGRVLECWKVAENRLVWKHQSHWESPSVRQFAAEVVDDSQAAVIVICEGIEDDMWKIVVDVVRLDFLTAETSRSLFAPDTKFINAFDWLRICGDIAIMGYNATNEIFMMNWKTQSSFVLLASSRYYYHHRIRPFTRIMSYGRLVSPVLGPVLVSLFHVPRITTQCFPQAMSDRYCRQTFNSLPLTLLDSSLACPVTSQDFLRIFCNSFSSF